MTEEKTIRVCAYLTLDMAKRVRIRAAEEGTTITRVIAEALEKHLGDESDETPNSR